VSPRYPDDDFDGRKVPPLVTIQDHTLAGTHQGSVHVEAGTFTLAGTLQGSLDLQPGTSALITGTQQGITLLNSLFLLAGEGPDRCLSRLVQNRISRRSLTIHGASCGTLLANSRVSGVIEF
jgi:hypothetical protein